MGRKEAIAKLKAANKAATVSARQDRVGDYNVTLDRLGAIFGNLSTTQKGFGRALAASNARQVEAMRRLSDRAVAGSGRDISGASRSARSLYGSAIGGAINQQLDAAQAHGRGGAMGTQAAAIGGQMLAFGSKQAQKYIQAGTQQAQASAQYEAAQALMYRAKDDAAAQAARQQSILDAQLQFQTWKKQQEYLAKQDPALGGKGGVPGMKAVADSAATASGYFREQLVNNPDATAQELVQGYVTQYGALDANEQTVLTAVARAVMGSVDSQGHTVDNYSRRDEAAAVMDALHLLYPNFSGHRDAIQKTILAGLEAQYANNVADAANNGGNGDPSQVQPVQKQPGTNIGAIGDPSQDAQPTGEYTGPDAGTVAKTAGFDLYISKSSGRGYYVKDGKVYAWNEARHLMEYMPNVNTADLQPA